MHQVGTLLGLDFVSARATYSFTAIPSVFIFRYKWERSRPSTSAVRLTLP